MTKRTHASASQLSRIVSIVWLAAPLALAAAPTRWLAQAPTLCLIQRVTGRPCPGCGMTRALSRLAHGDMRGAWRDNRRVVIVAPLLAGVWLNALIDIWPDKPQPRPTPLAD